jgi:uncharacterized protein with FMN-binding domain
LKVSGYDEDGAELNMKTVFSSSLSKGHIWNISGMAKAVLVKLSVNIEVNQKKICEIKVVKKEHLQ